MKLKNKILPLVGVATACAAVAPIALTSCNNNGGFVDLVQKYNSKITDIPGQDSWTTAKTTNTYYGNCAKNPEIFIDDCYWSASYINNYSTSNAKKQTKMLVDREKISNVSFAKFGDTSVDYFWTASFEREFDLKIEHDNYIENATTETITNTAKGKIKYVNVPVFARYVTDNYKMWAVCAETPTLTQTSYLKWLYLWDEKGVEASISIDVDFESTTITESETGSKTESHNHLSYNIKGEDQDSFENFDKAVLADSKYLTPLFNSRVQVFGYSHYLFNITPAA